MCFFDCAGSWLLCGLFPNCSKWELLPSCCAWVSHCGGLFCGAWDLGHVVFSSCSVWAPEHRAIVMVHRLSSSMACGIFQEQGWNLYLLPMDFLPLNLRAVPENMFYIKNPSVHFCVLACLIRKKKSFFFLSYSLAQNNISTCIFYSVCRIPLPFLFLCIFDLFL